MILIVMEGGKTMGPISEVEWVVVNSISDDFSESDSSSSEEDDDVSSSFGPLYELSQLMAQLPIKRGLSKYYEGKSRSFGRLGSVMSLEDVAKDQGKRMKSSFAPKPIIKKKSYSRKPTSPISLQTNF